MNSLALAAVLTVFQSPPAPPRDVTSASITAEVLDNVRAQRVGAATVGDLALPEPFLRRYADRIVRSSYEERFRIVVDDAGMAPAVTAPKRSESAPPAPASDPTAAARGVAERVRGTAGSSEPSSSLPTLRIVLGVACAIVFVVVLVRRRKSS